MSPHPLLFTIVRFGIEPEFLDSEISEKKKTCFLFILPLPTSHPSAPMSQAAKLQWQRVQAARSPHLHLAILPRLFSRHYQIIHFMATSGGL